MLKDTVKKIVPSGLWQSVRKAWYASVDFFRNFGPAERTMRYCDATIYYNRGNALIRRVKREGVYEKEMCEYIATELKKSKDPIYVDIGANLGIVIAYELQQVPGLLVYAFEPGPRQRELLEKTLAYNALQEKVVLSSAAMGESNGVQLFYTHDPKEIAKDGFIDTGRAHDAQPISVTVSTLDSWWEGKGKPHIGVIKVDTEGAELLILRGATQCMKECGLVFLLEIEPSNLRAYPYTHLDILSYLEEHNYALYTMKGERITKGNFDQLLVDEDTYVAKPASR